MIFVGLYCVSFGLGCSIGWMAYYLAHQPKRDAKGRFVK